MGRERSRCRSGRPTAQATIRPDLGGGRGPSFAADEYGRHPWQRRFQDKRQHDLEWFQYIRSKQEWAKKRVGKSRAMTDEQIGRHRVNDKMMDDFLREQQLLPSLANAEVKNS